MAETCSICDDPAHAHGWCKKHYQRWWKHGDPLYVGKRGPQPRPILGCERPRSEVDRFWSHVDRSAGPDACHPWKRATDSGGYSMVWFGGRLRRGHQVVWELANGPVPPDRDLDHECHNQAVRDGNCRRGRCPHRACCNERHIVLRTRPEHSAATPPFMHRRGEDHPRALLTEHQVREIRALLAAKTACRAIAEQYGIAIPTVYSIKRGKNWAWLP